jgi:hypothetical protein
MSDLPDLHSSLLNIDLAVVKIIARFWKMDVPVGITIQELAPKLSYHMSNPDVGEVVWGNLTDEQRQGLQTFLGSQGKLPQAMMERILGKIRKMGELQIEQKKPHEAPATIAEALYYRGLIYEAFEHVASGPRVYWYIPKELSQSLPSHKTGYANLESESGGFIGDDDDEEGHTIEPLEGNITPRLTADTSIVDDVTALLAYIQVRGGKLDGVRLAEDDHKALSPQLLNDDEARLTFMLSLAISADLVEVNEGHLYVRRTEARKWLEEKRVSQLQALITAWMKSRRYRDLWHVPGLHPEDNSWEYHPNAGREALREFLRDFTPRGAWWSLTDFISAIKETEPDFQRPNGDYNLWYILNDDDEYLSGFENWDAVEGSLLEFYINCPLYWLGMVDLADDAVRLNAYGRAFVGWEQFPNTPDQDDPMRLNPDGTIQLSRKVGRIDRFQVMRFTSWEGKATATTPYTYKLTPESIRRANEQDITADHITTFLKRIINNAPLPASVAKLLMPPSTSAVSSVTLERVLVLRTTSLEVMNFILETPATRRYLGARLGDLAVVVRADQWEALRTALDEKGIMLEVISG